MPRPPFRREPAHWFNYHYWWGACKYEDANAIVRQATGLSLGFIALCLIVLGAFTSGLVYWVFF